VGQEGWGRVKKKGELNQKVKDLSIPGEKRPKRKGGGRGRGTIKLSRKNRECANGLVTEAGGGGKKKKRRWRRKLRNPAVNFRKLSRVGVIKPGGMRKLRRQRLIGSLNESRSWNSQGGTKAWEDSGLYEGQQQQGGLRSKGEELPEAQNEGGDKGFGNHQPKKRERFGRKAVREQGGA